MLTPAQAAELKDAGLDYYNHNIDTSEAFYGEIITTRTYQDRLDTLKAVREAGLKSAAAASSAWASPSSTRADAAHARDAAGAPRKRADQPARAGRGHAARRRPPLDPIDLVRTIATARC
jgi:biotin synthase